MRNAVAVGADPDRIAILDNFCWGNPTFPDRLGSLVRTCQGCYDAALAYRTPFISGKDSLFNEFNGSPIPGTLLISAIGIVPDIEHTVTSDFKTAGNRIYLVGETRAELGGSLLHHLAEHSIGIAPTMPPDPLTRYRSLHGAILGGLVQSAHDLSEGGLAVALAEMCIAGRLGTQVALDALLGEHGTGLPVAEALFAESNGRLLVEVAEADAQAFEEAMAGTWVAPIGTVSAEAVLSITAGGTAVMDLPVDQLVQAWKRGAA